MKTYTILVADDYPDNVQIIANALRFTGVAHKIIRAPNGKVLIDLALKRIPDLIITDWEMPEMDGIEAIKHLKGNSNTKDIPIIMCTGIMVTSQSLKHALDSGAVDYIRKPIDSIELQARVHSMLKLSDSISIIKEQNKTLEDQKEKIRLQRDELKTANETKDKFFRIIAHDLRNPFNALLGISELIVEKIEDKDIDNALDLSKHLNQTANSAYELLENLLTWSLCQSNKIDFKPQENSLKEVFNYSVNFMLGAAQIKNINLSCKLENEIIVFADYNMLLTIIRNLVTNAIKFSNSGDSVTLDAFQDNQFVTVVVTDTGIGMNEATLQGIFSIVGETKSQGTANEPGTGLGLYLCKEFVEKHGGNIWVESTENVGSKFFFTLPTANHKE
jgi:signal transduction histidine kinase